MFACPAPRTMLSPCVTLPIKTQKRSIHPTLKSHFLGEKKTKKRREKIHRQLFLSGSAPCVEKALGVLSPQRPLHASFRKGKKPRRKWRPSGPCFYEIGCRRSYSPPDPASAPGREGQRRYNRVSKIRSEKWVSTIRM